MKKKGKKKMFNFTHTAEELRDLIQCMEARIAAMQAHVQKLVQQANEQAAPPAATPAVEEPKPSTENV